MIFNSMQYLIFFPIVFLVYFLFPPRIRYIWLLLSSYYFYMCWNPKYIILIVLSTLVTYLSGVAMEVIKDRPCEIRIRECYLKICIIVCFLFNLALLFYFKYFQFTISSIDRILNMIGLRISVPYHDVILPVGISFYIFQALGYTIDVYRGEIVAEKNILRYALFVSFFPQLVAGPIERSKNLLKQMDKPTYFNVEYARQGLLTMAYGLFMKVVIADGLASIVDPIYDN